MACTTDTTKRTVTITNAFDYYRTAPFNVSFTLYNFMNPSDNIITDSFGISTFTSSGYAIDTLQTNLTVNFLCIYPCMTCPTSSPTTCLSCYSTISYKWLYSATCLISCPIYYYGDTATNTCTQCISPCSTCNSASICTSCISGYTLLGNSCVNSTIAGVVTQKKTISIPYFFPFATSGVFLFMVTLIGLCCSKESKFRESAIGLIAIPEMLSWVAMVFCIKMYLNDWLLFSIGAGAIGAHVLFNFIFGIVHQTKIIAEASRDYQNFLKLYHGCHSFIIFLSFVYSFKMH